MDSSQRILALVIPRSRHFRVLVEAHDKLGHKGVRRTYHLVKHQYYREGMNKDIHKYINSCALCKKEKAKTQVCLLQMTDIPDRPFDIVAMNVVSETNISTSGNQHILCPCFILSDNGTDFKNQLLDNVLQQLGIDCIFLPHITHKIMENWWFSTNTLNLLLRNFVKGSRQLGQIHQPSISWLPCDATHCNC